MAWTALPQQLVQGMAEALGTAKSTTLVHDRHLVVAGLRTKHGRGRGAARVTPRDAAHLLIAVLASAALEDSVRSVERYAATRVFATEGSLVPYAGLGLAELEALPKDHSFADALEALIASAAIGDMSAYLAAEVKGTRATSLMVAPRMEVSVATPGTFGEIRIAGVKEGHAASVQYALPTPWNRKRRKPPSGKELDSWVARVRESRGTSDWERSNRVSERTILHLAEVLAPRKKESA